MTQVSQSHSQRKNYRTPKYTYFMHMYYFQYIHYINIHRDTHRNKDKDNS